MAYAQKNYLQIQGINGKFRIDQIGCLLDSFCNYLERKGRGISPVDLNAELVRRGIYIDIDDGVRDDLGWNSISLFDGNIVVTGTGKGKPTNDDSIVKFNYVGKSGFTTHFCLVADAARGIIIDSWDGVLKSWDVYGGPVAWASYGDNTPVAVTPIQPPVQQKGRFVFLPAAAGQWRAYPLDKPASVGNEIGKLTPGNPDFAPGLYYEILDNPRPNVYTINTNAWGKVNIWGGPETIIQFVDSIPGTAPVQSVPAPAPAPDPVPPAVQPEATVPETAESGTVEASPHQESKSDVPAADPNAYDPSNDYPDVKGDPTWTDTWSEELRGTFDSDYEYMIKDLEDPTHPDIRLPKDQGVKCDGTYVINGKTWYHPVLVSYGKKHMYLIPNRVIGGEESKVDEGDKFMNSALREFRELAETVNRQVTSPEQAKKFIKAILKFLTSFGKKKGVTK